MMGKNVISGHHARGALAVAALLLLAACAPARQSITVPQPDPAPSPAAFTVCHGYGCQFTSPVRLSAATWDWLAAPFRAASFLAASGQSAEQERERIKTYIGRMEIIAGLYAGTLRDKAGTSVFAAGRGQLDCEDETVNTTTYLKLLDGEGLLAFHTVAAPAGRGFAVGGWPHLTAAIRERKSRILYAVDSWYFDNGIEPFVIPIERWLAGQGPSLAGWGVREAKVFLQ